jgi:hypothetical protein
MGINIRTKGQGGEREVADALNAVIHKVLRKLNLPIPVKAIVQRNQNQSAVGGSDLSGTMGLSIEVKRQETLSINTWWKQCETSAKETLEMPVLIYRQNSKKWNVVMYGHLDYPFAGNIYMTTRVTIDWQTFLDWYAMWVELKIQNGEKLAMN